MFVLVVTYFFDFFSVHNNDYYLGHNISERIPAMYEITLVLLRLLKTYMLDCKYL